MPLEHWFSDDYKRAVQETLFGFACYEGSTIDGRFKGTHVGVTGTLEIAQKFLVNGSKEGLLVIEMYRERRKKEGLE